MQLEVRNFFGLVELIFTFVQGSPARHAYFLEQQKILCPNSDALHLKGLSETRWNCASALRRLSTERVFRAVIETVQHVSMTTTDGAVRGTAAGLLNSISTFKFIVCLELLSPVMEAVNNVSEALQTSSSSDILNAQTQLAALTAELSILRSDDSYAAAFATAEALAQQLDIDCALPVERQRKLP